MRILLAEIIESTIGGGWGDESPSPNTTKVRIIRGADFPAAGLHRSAEFPERWESESTASSRTLRVGDIVLETSGGTPTRPTGRTVYVHPDLLASSPLPLIPASFCRLVRIDSSQAIPLFVYYSLQNLYNAGGTWPFQNTSTGISNFQFSLFQFEYTIPSFNLKQQRAIAEVLGALDDKIAANATLVQSGVALCIGIASTQSVEHVPLSSIADVGRQAVLPSALGTSVVDHYSLPAFDVDQLPAREPVTSILSQKFVVTGESVLVSKLNPRFPRIWDLPVADSSVPSVASTEFVVLRATAVSSSVLWAALSNPAFAAALEGKVAGTSGSHQRVRPDDLMSTPVANVNEFSPEAQGTLAKVGNMILRTRHETRQLATLRDTLLPALMSGRLRVRDAEQQVGDVL